MQLNETVKLEMAKVVASNQRLNEILDVIKQGICTFTPNFKVEKGFSPFLKDILDVDSDDDMLGLNIIDKIFENPVNSSDLLIRLSKG